MPKLKYRFRVIFQNFGVSTPTTELTKQVMDFKRPSVSYDDIIIPIYNSELKLAGKYHWAEVTCNLRDDASGNVSKLVGEQVQKQMDFLEMASASAGIDYKFTTRFEVLDGGNGASEPRVLEQWELYGCYLKNVDYGAMDYGSSDPVTISLTILFDNANQVPEGSGIGGVLGRTLGDVVTGIGTAQV
jgi:tetrahydromethanopterin S-methyltransferase subunit H